MAALTATRLGLVAGALSGLAASAEAQTVEEAQAAKIEEARRAVADEIQLSAYDLVDELVYGWRKAPVFEKPTPVVLADVTVPVGLGTALQSLLENHLHTVLIANPATNLVLTHCPACTAVVVRSGPDGTTVARGVDDPAVLERFEGTAAQYALFVDVEAEGASLVLRARITRLDGSLAVVWARTISSAASAPSMLRRPDDLKSAEEARKELLDALNDRGVFNFPVRLAVRLYDDGNQGNINPPPFVWIQAGAELSLNQARAWTASLLLGYGYVPSAFDGFMGQVRLNRLLTGTARSFVRPDLYAFVGANVFALSGPAAQIFQRDQLTTEQVIQQSQGDSPTQVFSAVHIGLELRLGNRMGAAVFFESLPSHIGADAISTYLGVFHSFGTELAIWF